MILMFIIIVVVVGCGYLAFYLYRKSLVKNAKELNYLDYKADKNDKVYKSIIIYFDKNKIKYIYKDGREEEKDISYEVFNKVNEIFIKYGTFEWNYHDRSEFEYIDDENTLVYYTFSNGDASYADIQTHLKGKKEFFSELKEYLISL